MDQITPTLKLSVLYGKPHDPAAFEAHCLGTHMPLVAATPAPARAGTAWPRRIGATVLPAFLSLVR